MISDMVNFLDDLYKMNYFKSLKWILIESTEPALFSSIPKRGLATAEKPPPFDTTLAIHTLSQQAGP